MNRKWLWWLAGLVVVIAVPVVVLATLDANRIKPWVNSRVSAALERPFAINGDLQLHWVREIDGKVRWWLPRPQVSAGDITIANPSWSKEKQLARIHALKLVLDPLPLFSGNIALPLLEADRAAIALERKSDGRNNWSFGDDSADKPSRWRVVPGSVRIHNSTLRFDDARQKLAIAATADTNERGVTWKLNGTFNGAAVTGSGHAGALLALQDKDTPFPLEAHLKVGETRIDATGTMTDPSHLAALDMRLAVAGASMAHLYPLTGVTLPETPPFSTSGRLVGKLDDAGGTWRYENFKGKVGDSDIGGTLTYAARAPRPLLSGELVSQLLNFADLAPLIGADSNADKERRNAAVMQPEGKALPVEPFKTERWKSIDADVKFSGRKIVRAEELPITDLNTRVRMQDGVLTLSPLDFGVAGGDLISTIRLDGSKEPLQATLKITSRHIKLRELFPTVEAMRSSMGEVNAAASLSATGQSVAALLGASNGEIKALIDRGTVSKFLLEAAGLNIGSAVLAKLFGDREVQIHCAVGDFTVENGVASTRTSLVDTEDATIAITGTVSLLEEKLDLTVKPDSKGVRVLSLRAPLYVDGTFKNPDVRIDKGILALRAGGAVALGALAPPAALLTLIDTGTDEKQDNGCAQLLAAAHEKPQAPPPGQTAVPAAKR